MRGGAAVVCPVLCVSVLLRADWRAEERRREEGGEKDRVRKGGRGERHLDAANSQRASLTFPHEREQSALQGVCRSSVGCEKERRRGIEGTEKEEQTSAASSGQEWQRRRDRKDERGSVGLCSVLQSERRFSQSWKAGKERRRTWKSQITLYTVEPMKRNAARAVTHRHKQSVLLSRRKKAKRRRTSNRIQQKRHINVRRRRRNHAPGVGR